MDRVLREKEKIQGQLARLAEVYTDGRIDKKDYLIRKHALTEALQGLVVPEVDATTVAGEMMDDVSRLWQEASLKERHKLLASMLEAVYIDTEARPLSDCCQSRRSESFSLISSLSAA